jgi:hypothetical protein
MNFIFILSGKRAWIFIAPFLSTQSPSPPKAIKMLIVGSFLKIGSIGILGKTLG